MQEKADLDGTQTGSIIGTAFPVFSRRDSLPNNMVAEAFSPAACQAHYGIDRQTREEKRDKNRCFREGLSISDTLLLGVAGKELKKRGLGTESVPCAVLSSWHGGTPYHPRTSSL